MDNTDNMDNYEFWASIIDGKLPEGATPVRRETFEKDMAWLRNTWPEVFSWAAQAELRARQNTD